MDSLISRTGKLRSLARELETKFDDAAATSCPSRMSQHSAKIHSTTSAPFHRPASQYQSQPTAEVHQFLEDADPKGRWCIWHVHECMVQGWSRGVLHGGAAQLLWYERHKTPKKKLDSRMNTGFAAPIHPSFATDLLLRFHKLAEEKMKSATYVSNPQKD